MAIQANQVLEIIWIVWLMSWVAASFWSDRAQKRAATLETWIYRAAMIAGGILLVPWIGQLLEIYGAYCRRVPMLIPCLSRRR